MPKFARLWATLFSSLGMYLHLKPLHFPIIPHNSMISSLTTHKTILQELQLCTSTVKENVCCTTFAWFPERAIDVATVNSLSSMLIWYQLLRKLLYRLYQSATFCQVDHKNGTWARWKGGGDEIVERGTGQDESLKYG